MLIESLVNRNVISRISKKSFSEKTAKFFGKSSGNILKILDSKPVRFPRSEIIKGVSLIKKYPQPQPIPWEQVSTKLSGASESVKKVILKSCVELKDADIVISYYKYFKNKGGNFSQVDLFLIVKLLSDCRPEKILQHEETVLELYKECKDYLMISEVFQLHGITVFSYVPYCFGEFVSLVKNPSFTRKEIMVARAFDFDHESLAWELLETYDIALTSDIVNPFVNYCIRKAIRNEFSVDLLQRLFNLCQQKGFYICTENINCTIQPLVSVLTHCTKDYVWSARKSVVNLQMNCLNCNSVLNKIKLTDEEFQNLKEAVFNTLLPEDVFLKSTHQEIKKFQKFLATCKPYNFVLDGLNFLYRGINMKKKEITYQMFKEYIVQNKKKVLIISRKHFKDCSLFKSLPDVQYFHTEDSSDDDFFIIWAALQGGLGTGVLTCDFLSTHTAKLSPDMKVLFVKWQLGHQHMVDTRLGIAHPSCHVGLPQCTESPETGGNSYKWHFTYEEKNPVMYSFRLSFNWMCLQATPRNSRPEEKACRTNYFSKSL